MERYLELSNPLYVNLLLDSHTIWVQFQRDRMKSGPFLEIELKGNDLYDSMKKL